MKNRKDGKRVKNLDGMHGLITHIKPYRADSDVYINTKIDVTEMVKYVEKLKKTKEYEHLTYFHVFSTAIAKLVYNRPLLNRFVINRRYYDRNFVNLSFVAKREFTDTSEENFSSLIIEKDDNLKTISDKISGKVKSVRQSKLNSADDFMDKVGKLPVGLLRIICSLLKFADNHDLIPQSLTKNSIYHSSVIMTNLGSINCGSIYHNLTDFGTNSILIAIGKITEEPMVVNGKIEIRKVCDFGINLDERIADGFYFTKSLEYFRYVLEHPELLEENANVAIDIKK